MNQFKNTVIFILSSVIVVQAVFLVYFMRRATSVKPVKVAVSERPGAAVRPSVDATNITAVPEPSPRPVERPSAGPVRPVAGRIVLVLDDWGNNLKHRDFITGNDARVTLAILPFKPHSPLIAKLAYDKGKGVIIHMPMEPLHKDSYGLEENTLMTRMNARTVTRLLDEAFKTVPYATGISNHMGSAATEDPALMKTVLMYLKARGSYFLDSYVTPKTVGRATAKRLGVRYAARDVFIDNEADPALIREQMEKLSELARSKGMAVGIGHDRPVTIAVLTEMIPELEAQGFEFINLDDAVNS